MYPTHQCKATLNNSPETFRPSRKKESFEDGRTSVFLWKICLLSIWQDSLNGIVHTTNTDLLVERLVRSIWSKSEYFNRLVFGGLTGLTCTKILQYNQRASSPTVTCSWFWHPVVYVYERWCENGVVCGKVDMYYVFCRQVTGVSNWHWSFELVW